MAAAHAAKRSASAYALAPMPPRLIAMGRYFRHFAHGVLGCRL